MKSNNVFNVIVNASNALGSLWTCALMFIITADVLSRTFFNYTMVGTSEIVANSLVGIAFLQFTFVLKEDRHVRATVLYDKFPPKGQAVLDLLSSLIGLLLFIAILFPSWKLLLSAIRVGEFEGDGALRVPTSPIRALVVYGSVLMLVEYALQVIKGVQRLIGKQPGTIAPSESN